MISFTNDLINKSCIYFTYKAELHVRYTIGIWGKKERRKKKSYKRNRTPRLVLNFCEFNWENGDNKLLVSWYIFYCFIFTASSNLHREDVLCHYDNDSSSDEGSEFSTDQISLHEKSLTSRISAHYLSTLREVRMALKKNRISHVFNQESWKLCKTFTALIFGSQNNGTSACCEYIGNISISKCLGCLLWFIIIHINVGAHVCLMPYYVHVLFFWNKWVEHLLWL